MRMKARKLQREHQQTDKITPWTIVSLSVVEDAGESDSKLWKDTRVNVIRKCAIVYDRIWK